jgi:hypothetical protein
LQGEDVGASAGLEVEGRHFGDVASMDVLDKLIAMVKTGG